MCGLLSVLFVKSEDHVLFNTLAFIVTPKKSLMERFMIKGFIVLLAYSKTMNIKLKLNNRFYAKERF